MATAHTPASHATITLDQALRRAHDAETTTHPARQVIDHYEDIKQARQGGDPHSFWEDIDSPQALTAIRQAAHEVAHACHTQRAAVCGLIAAARQAGATTFLVRRGPRLRDGIEANISTSGRHARICATMGTIHIRAWDQNITHNGAPITTDPWIHQLPHWLGLDPDAKVPETITAEDLDDMTAGNADEPA